MSEKYTVDDLLTGFSTYEQQADVVCCWHSWYEGFVEQGTFDHYPKRDLPSGDRVTPDFVVEFDDGYRLVGEICRLPNQEDGFRRSVEQALRYTQVGGDADVMMLLRQPTAAECESRMIREGLLTDADQLVVVSYLRDATDVKTCWWFQRATHIRSATFRDTQLGDKSLHILMTEQMKSVPVPLRFGLGYRSRFPFMNDEPPALYTAAYLWQSVFNMVLGEDDYTERLVRGEPTDINVTVAMIKEICDANGIHLKAAWATAALDLLREARLAEKLGDGSYDVRYGKIRATPGGSHEVHQQIAERLAHSTVSSTGPEVPAGQTQIF